MSKPLRQSQPEFAAWIDELRRVFGKDEIDGQIRRGMQGEPTFHVKTHPGVEPALELGTPQPAPRMALDADGYLEWGAKIRALEAALAMGDGK